MPDKVKYLDQQSLPAAFINENQTVYNGEEGCLECKQSFAIEWSFMQQDELWDFLTNRFLLISIFNIGVLVNKRLYTSHQVSHNCINFKI